MAFKSIFKTKSLVPKITKISSSIFGRRRSTDAPLLTPSGTPVSETLVETNRILEEIQKQLTLDFAYRIAQEEDEIKNIRKNTATMKGGKIGGGEKDTKLGGGIGKVFQTVTAPVKGIFSRILGFFGWLAAGFVVNKGLKWLADNPERIDKIVNVVTKHWKLIAGLVVGGIILDTVLRLAGTIALLKSSLGLLGIGAGARGAVAAGNRTGLFTKLYRRGVTTTKTGTRFTGMPGTSPEITQFTRTKTPLSRFLQKQRVTSKLLARNLRLPKTRIGGGLFSLLMGGLEYKGRLDEGQSHLQAGMGTAGTIGGGMAGAKGGAMAGAAIGAMFGGVGAVPGAVIGGLIGGIGGSWLGARAMDSMSGVNAGNQLSQRELNKHEDLFHDRGNMGGNVKVINVNKMGEAPPSFGNPSEDSNEMNFPDPSPEDNSNPNIASTQSNLGIYTNGSWSFG